MKKFIFVFLPLIFVLTIFVSGVENTPKVMVNGKVIDTEAVLINDRTYVPLRGVFEETGADVSWDDSQKMAVVSTGKNAKENDSVIPAVIEKMSPAVVGIIGKCEDKDNPGEQYIAHGSGVIVKSGGEILTNAHVVENMVVIFVVLNDGSSYEAKVKLVDKESDLALIKINKIGLPVARFADIEDIAVGKMVIAIGTPISFSLRNSATVGYISGINRAVDRNYRFIQTDAAVNQGNSGGPLVNLNGEVMGITSGGYMGFGISNTSFAIPSDTVQYVIKHYESYGKVRRTTLKAELKEDWLAEMGVPSTTGLTIRSMEKESPLLMAGVKNQEILISIDGAKVNGLVELNEILKKYLPGDTVTVCIKNGESLRDVKVTLTEKQDK